MTALRTLTFLFLSLIPAVAGTNSAPINSYLLSTNSVLKWSYTPPKFTVTLYASSGAVAHIWKHCSYVSLDQGEFHLECDGVTVYCTGGPVSIEEEK